MGTIRKDGLWGSAALLLAAVIWGLGYVVIADSLSIINVHYMMSYRYILAFVGMAIAFARRIPRLNLRIVLEGCLLGALLYFSQYFQTLACEKTTVGKVSFITAMYVVVVPFIERVVYKKHMGRNCLISILLAIPGLLLLTGANGVLNIGDVLAMIGSVGFAVHILFSDRYAGRDDVGLLTMTQFASAAVFSTIALPINGLPLILPSMTRDVWLRMIYMGIISTMLGFFLQMWGQKRVKPFLASLLLATEALFGLLFAITLLGETLTVWTTLGCLLMFAAIVAAERRDEKSV